MLGVIWFPPFAHQKWNEARLIPNMGQETSPLPYNVRCCDVPKLQSKFLSSGEPFPVLDGWILVGVEDDVDPVTSAANLQCHRQNKLGNFPKVDLIPFHFLDYAHSIYYGCRMIRKLVSWGYISLLILTRAALLVLRWRPSAVASAHGNGPRGWDSTSAICRFHPCAITMMRQNNALSAWRITDLPLILTCFFLHKFLKVFSLLILIGRWRHLIGGSLWSFLALKFV